MNQYDKTNPWGSHSPLMSLTGISLIITASSRLSCSIIVFFLLEAIYTITLCIIHGGKSIIPAKYKTAITIMIVTFISSLFYFFIDLIHPVSALELYFIVFLIPLTFLSSHLEKTASNFSASEEIIFGAKQASILGGIIIAIALIREPLGYGTLSLPFSNKMMYLLPESIQEQAVLQVFSAPLGGFLITACLIALVRFVTHQQDTSSVKENRND
jgi:Na+-translocating ferredoxin:NAD+ oxidoreductase RnfE subunit